jgi:hypothetical protein
MRMELKWRAESLLTAGKNCQEQNQENIIVEKGVKETEESITQLSVDDIELKYILQLSVDDIELKKV